MILRCLGLTVDISGPVRVGMTLLAAGIGSNPDCSGSGRAAGGAGVAIAG